MNENTFDANLTAAVSEASRLGLSPVIGRRGCIIQDDRTEEQKKTHIWGVVARDRCLSGWGQARGGVSRCAWACGPDVNSDRVFNWVKSRSEMSYVNLVDLSTYRAPRGTAHFHIYVCGPDHPAARY